MSPVGWFGVLVGLFSICALPYVALDSVLNPQTPTERERTRTAVRGWKNKNVRARDLPHGMRRTGECVSGPPPSPTRPPSSRRMQ